MLSFATASSEAAYPKILDALDRFGVKRKISSFVLPLGYSFNLDGSMMYCTFATLFIAQAYDIKLSIGTQVTMLLILMNLSWFVAPRLHAEPRAEVGGHQIVRFDLEPSRPFCCSYCQLALFQCYAVV